MFRGRFYHILPLLFLVAVQLGQKGCKKKEKVTEQNLSTLTASAYDLYILDMPIKRDEMKKKGIKSINLMEVSTLALPAEEGFVVRKDSLDVNGKIQRTTFMMEAKWDSIRYEYQATGQIEKVHRFYQGSSDSTTTHYFYDDYGMLNNAIFYRDKVTAYEFDHNLYGKMTDKKLSEDSPTYSPVREIYKFNSHGNMIQALTLTKNVPTAKQKRYYDKKNRLVKSEELVNGKVMSSRNYQYNEEGMLSIRKDVFILSADEKETKVYEFVYEYY